MCHADPAGYLLNRPDLPSHDEIIPFAASILVTIEHRHVIQLDILKMMTAWRIR